jgi:hypothetical protein
MNKLYRQKPFVTIRGIVIINLVVVKVIVMVPKPCRHLFLLTYQKLQFYLICDFILQNMLEDNAGKINL